MKKLFLLFVCLLIFPILAHAVATQKGGNLFRNYAGTGSDTSPSFDVAGYQVATFSVSGTFSATLIPETTINGVDWFGLTCFQLDGTTPITAFTLAGNWRCNITGNTNVRVRRSSYSSGTFNVDVNVSDQGTPITKQGGGGGGGGVSSVDATSGVETITGTPISSNGTIRGSAYVNDQSGTTYTLDVSDRGKLVSFSNSSPIAVSAVGNLNGWYTDIENRGVNTVTITPTVGLIDGIASLAVGPSSGVRLFSNGTNYFTMRGGGSGGAPIDAGFLTDRANGVLSNEINLGALTTGALIGTVSGGISIISAFAGVTCTNQVLRILPAALTGATCVTITSAFVDSSVAVTGASNAWASGVKQTFAPNTTTSGFNVGTFAGDPSTPVDGDEHYNSSTLAFRFRENGAWRGLGIAAETLDLQGTFALGKSITGANSRANAFRVGDGVTPMCHWTDATLGPMARACTDANTLTIIASTFIYKIWDEAGALSMEEIKPSGASPDLMWQYVNATYRPKGTVSWNADAMHTDGTQCGQPTERILNSGAPMATIICTNNASSSIYGQVEMPDRWDGGTVTFMWTGVQTAADTAIMNSHIAAACRASGDTINNTWGTSQTLNIAAVGGSNKKDRVTSAAVTPNGTCTNNGTLLEWRWQLDTSTTTAVATLHNLSVKMEYATKSRSD